MKAPIKLRRREAVEPIDLPDDLPPLLKRLYANRGGIVLRILNAA